MAETRRNCELCKGEATVYCPSDSAFLCWTCDAEVHNANFLVARHVRTSICRACRNLDGNRFSGTIIMPPERKPCRSCSPDEFCAVTDSLSSSSSCVSSTTEAGNEAVSKRRREKAGGQLPAVDFKVEGVLVNWCRRMAVSEKKSRKVIPTAVEVLGGCLDRMTVLPFRVSLAAAFWVALRLCGSDAVQELRRVEMTSGVPAKLILVTESRFSRVLKRRRSCEDHVEGWAEC